MTLSFPFLADNVTTCLLAKGLEHGINGIVYQQAPVGLGKHVMCGQNGLRRMSDTQCSTSWPSARPPWSPALRLRQRCQSPQYRLCLL
ncbi:hypothetical protein VFPBJ_05592 [Purpureocillium lilacinum]|uniref:Uncharacterized protein n=1 Tax=Purpureocillium lilacinum TaxID=33203 RepID=A0A179GPZ5_PURLI|nr:hypothetical protein VFPBJ_05592 [Purpureocillium lilacinum]